MNKDELLNVLNTLDESKDSVILLDGKWGSGKTHLLNEFIKKYKKHPVYYVSLLGKRNVDDINTSLYMEVHRDRIIENVVPSSVSPFANIPTLDYALKIKEGCSYIVILDDLERYASSHYDEFLSYVSSLVLKGVKVIVVSNLSYLGAGEKFNFDMYKEKIFDHIYKTDLFSEDVLERKFGIHYKYFDESLINLLNSIAGAPYMMDEYVPDGLLVYDSNSPKARAKAVRHIDNLGDLLQMPRYRVTKGTKQKPIREYLTNEQVDLIANGYVKIGDVTVNFEDFIDRPAPEKLTMAQQLNAEGEDLYFNEDYKKAINKFKAALDKDPKLYIAYSNLSLCYYKMGQYENGLRVVQDLIESKYFNGMPNDIRGYTYYNAALCRAALGDKSKDAGQRHEHYVMAMRNLELAKKFSGNQYNAFSEELQKKLGEKITAMRAGIQKIEQADKHNAINFVNVVEKNKIMS